MFQFYLPLLLYVILQENSGKCCGNNIGYFMLLLGNKHSAIIFRTTTPFDAAYFQMPKTALPRYIAEFSAQTHSSFSLLILIYSSNYLLELYFRVCYNTSQKITNYSQKMYGWYCCYGFLLRKRQVLLLY